VKDVKSDVRNFGIVIISRMPGLPALAMKTQVLCSTLLFAAFAAVNDLSAGTLGPDPLFAPAPTPWRYTLLAGSHLIDDCLICGRPSIQVPLRGTFDLRLVESNVLFDRYKLENIDFKSGPGLQYTVEGSGEFRIGGEFAITQEMKITADVKAGSETALCEFESDTKPVTRPFPMMDITLEQTNGTLTQTFTLRLEAAPVREMWFSTATQFTAGGGIEAGKVMSGGDLLSTSGRRVKSSADLLSALGVPPAAPDPGLDAVDVLPGGEIALSLDTAALSNAGPVYPGDLLSSKGRVISRYHELLAPFGIMPLPFDAGLDAVHVLHTGEILFSIESSAFSGRLGKTLQRGDLLSSNGTIVRTHEQLMEKFHFLTPPTDNGLDALYQWPHDEIWFSTEFGFTDNNLGPIAPGDIISDAGYIVLRNADMTAAFSPPSGPGTANLGFDALFVISDMMASNVDPKLSLIKSSQGISLGWQSTARVFQVERSTNLSDFEAVSPIIPDHSWSGPEDAPRAFFRLRQW
jgi:hypothetical protein